ncbi:MAG: carbohydrate binding domain-containing protein [Acidobacteriota bacterium]
MLLLSHHRFLGLLAAILLVPAALFGQSGWFAFTLPWDDDSPTFLDASDLLVDFPGQDPTLVIDARGYVRAGGDGHFYFEKSGRRARFWGVNFVFNANFPPAADVALRPGEFPDPQASEKVARRLAKLGVNVVRFHHMDFFGSPNGIFDPAFFPADTQHLDEGQLRRLDYLIYQLRKRGIYVNLNLKVARHFGAADGVADSGQFSGSLSFFQGVSHYNPRMIELQKEYARQLLTHRNVYTGKTYAEDPAVLFVEIANEDSLFGNLLNEGGLNYLPGVADSLPQRYSLELDTLWNSWLSNRYPSGQALQAAWSARDAGFDPSDRIRNGGFESGLGDWTVQQIGSARAAAAVETGAGPDGSAALRIELTSDGTDWHVQAFQNGHAIEKNRTYEFSFYARAAQAGTIRVDIMKGAPPWQNYGLSQSFSLATSWQRFTARFRANESDGATVRPTFELGVRDNTIWIDQVELRRSAPRDLDPSESLEGATVRRLLRSELGSYSDTRVADLFRFYSSLDEAYFTEMRRFFKQDLGVRGLVTGTAPWWAYLGDIAVQSKMDFVDGHYYWDHPYWVGVPAWSPTGWRINNQSLVNQLQDLSALASLAVEGKPFTVSEFNHAFPNRHALEGPLLLAAVANLQDWDAVYLFDYAGSTANFDDAFTTSFFSMAGNPVKSAQLPIASRMFLGAQNAAASRSIGIELARDEMAGGYAQGLINGSRFLEAKGLDRRAFLDARLRIRTFDRPTPAPVAFALPAGTVTSSNQEVIWDRANTAATFVQLRGSAVQGAIGFLKGRTIDCGDWSFKVADDAPDHLALLLQSRDGVGLRQTRRMILSVWTEHGNSDMIWNETLTSVENRWGRAPTLVRPVRLDLHLAFAAGGAGRLAGVRIWPLDDRGNRKEALTVVRSGAFFDSQIDTGRDQTIWYELEINDPATALDFTIQPKNLFHLYSDAAPAPLEVGWYEIENRSGPALLATPLLEYSTRGVVTSVVRLPPSRPTARARVPVLRDRWVDSAVALLNRQSTPLSISLRLVPAAGAANGETTVLLGPGETRAFFVGEQFPSAGSYEGILELTATAPFHSMALRSITNASGDFSLTPYPVETPAIGPLYFAHLVADGDYSSEVLFWNSDTQAITARLDLFSPAGAPVAVGAQPASSELTIAPAQLVRVRLPRSATPFYGYARLTRTGGPSLPSTSAVITRWDNDRPVSEIGIPATPLLQEELLVAAERPGQRTALALLNTAATSAVVDLELVGSGTSIPEARVQVTLQPGEKRSFFLDEVFSRLPTVVTGLLQVRSSGPIATLALLGVTNARNEFLMAALTGEPGGALSAGATTTIPRLVSGGGYRSILYLAPAVAGAANQGSVRFFDSAGTARAVAVR